MIRNKWKHSLPYHVLKNHETHSVQSCHEIWDKLDTYETNKGIWGPRDKGAADEDALSIACKLLAIKTKANIW